MTMERVLKVQTLIIVVMDKVRCRHDALLVEKEVGWWKWNEEMQRLLLRYTRRLVQFNYYCVYNYPSRTAEEIEQLIAGGSLMMGLWYSFDNSSDWWYPPPSSYFESKTKCNATASQIMASLLQILLQHKLEEAPARTPKDTSGYLLSKKMPKLSSTPSSCSWPRAKSPSWS